MAEEKTTPAPKKKTRRRGYPWTSVANAIKGLGRDEAESEQIAWNLWFETACPKSYELAKDTPDALRELYEQLSGERVDDGDTDDKQAGDKPPEIEPETE